MRTLVTSLLSFLCMLVLAGCQTNVSRKDAIETALYSYEKSVRWTGPREGYRYLREDLKSAFLPPGIESIKVVGYTVLDPPVEVQENTVVQTVELRYVNIQTQIVRSLIDEQVWESEDGKTWLRANPIPILQ